MERLQIAESMTKDRDLFHALALLGFATEPSSRSRNVVVSNVVTEVILQKNHGPLDHTMLSNANGMSNSFIVFDWIVLYICDFFSFVAN